MVELSEFTVTTSTGQYVVSTGADQLAAAVAAADVVLIDEALVGHLPAGVDAVVITLTSTEEAKTLAGCERIILALQAAGVRRGHHLVAIGGGVVQDVATLVADLYMRGLPWSYVPTTLMSMADSCIGGKSSINVGEVKNLVGGIYPPQQVYIDPVFLDTLPDTALASGFAEAVKIAFCRGDDAFNGYLDRFARFDTDPAALIEHVLLAKKWFIEIDEHDKLERRLLNFGHTFGHALESAVDHAIPHGLGVAVGVLCACEHPAAARNTSTEALAAHCRVLLDMAPEVVTSALAKFDPDVYERAFRSDKKHATGWFHLILPAEAGGVSEAQIAADAHGWSSVLETTNSILDSLRKKSS